MSRSAQTGGGAMLIFRTGDNLTIEDIEFGVLRKSGEQIFIRALLKKTATN